MTRETSLAGEADQSVGESAEADVSGAHAVDDVFGALGIEVSSPDSEDADGRLSELIGRATPPPWVLHVEDDVAFSAGLKLLLEAYGVAVIRAFHGMEGCQDAFSNPPDAIILDLKMPRGNGEFVLERLKKNATTKDIPVIILTGKRDETLKQKMLALGADEYMTKPVALKELVKSLAKYIDILDKPALAIHGAGQKP